MIVTLRIHAHYLRYFVDVPLVPTAVTLVIAEAAIAMTGLRRSARLTMVLSGIQVAGLVAIIAIAEGLLRSRSRPALASS